MVEYNWNDQVKEDEVDNACSGHAVGTPKERDD
jgi:hypothetical protein